jgi:hypothetical protein
MATNDDDRRRRRHEEGFDDEGSRWPDEYDDSRRPDPRGPRGDATGGLIPYKNGAALAAYYCGVFGLIPCFFLLGIFGIVPIILGFYGLKHARAYPEARGQAHAITGIVLGSIQILVFLGQVGFIVVRIVGHK